MNKNVFIHHVLVLLAVALGITGMGIVFTAVTDASVRDLTIGVPMLMIGLWWSGRELGRSMLLSRTQPRGRRG